MREEINVSRAMAGSLDPFAPLVTTHRTICLPSATHLMIDPPAMNSASSG
jgi:hypothetical protein